MAAKPNEPDLNSDERLRQLFELAVTLGPDERLRFLETHSGVGDDPLLAELQDLLNAHDLASGDASWKRSALANEALQEQIVRQSEIGELVGNYRLTALIGAGGMGRVYRAARADDEYAQSIAIKRIKPGLDAALIVSRFRSERQILAGLEHPYIARLLDGGTDAQGLPYLVMEYVDGMEPLRFCDEHHLNIAARLSLFRDICSAVQYAHEHMVVHRDLKPGNILVTKDGTPKLLDFGIAKVLTPDPSALAETGPHLITARYASPEQVQGQPITTASDVYSLGVILYELLTGHSPYRDPSLPAHQLLRAVCEEGPVKPSTHLPELAGDLEVILCKALKKDARERYLSVDRLSEDIQRYLENRPILARADSFSYVARKFVVRHKLGSVAAVVVMGVILLSFVLISRAQTRAERRFNEVRELAHSVIFDYHDAIEPLAGSTPVLERLVKDGLRYLDSLRTDVDSAELRREVVDAYVRIGEVQGDSYHVNLGNHQGALDSAAKAVAAAEILLRSDRSPAAAASAASAYGLRGSLLYSGGDLGAAETNLRKSIDLGEEAVREEPAKLDYSFALARNLRALADLYGGNGMQSLGNTTRALELEQRAVTITKQLAERFPNNIEARKAEYHNLLALCGVERASGRITESTADLRQVVVLIGQVLAREPNDASAKVELANAGAQLAQLLLDARKPDEAVPYIRETVSVLETLASADPHNAFYRRSLSVVDSQYAATVRASGNFRLALALHAEAVAVSEALNRETPGSQEFRADIGVNERKWAETLVAAGDAAAALSHSQAASTRLCALAEKGEDLYLKANCGRALLITGVAESRLGRVAAALGTYKRAEAVAASVSQADPASAVFRSDLARTESALGSGLVVAGRKEDAMEEYRRALAAWSGLRTRHSITAEDEYRAQQADLAMAALTQK